MRKVFTSGGMILVFESQAERDQYFSSIEENERKRHSAAILDIHSDYMQEVKAENSYNESTRRKLEALRGSSKLESEVKEPK